MKIDKKLNLVVPVVYDTGTIYVHSAPLTAETFENYYLVLAKAHAAIYGEGLSYRTGPRVAMMLLRDVAKRMNPEGSTAFSDDVEAGLINEIKRLTSVAVLGSNGWENIPWSEAITKGSLDKEDAQEVENAIAFFIIASAIHKRAEVKPIVTTAAKLWGALTTLLNCTEYAASLPTSTEAESSGKPAE